MTSLPPPIPPIKVEVLTTPPPQLNKKEVKQLTELKRKEVNLGRIVEANNKKMKADSESELPSAFFSPPDRKPFLQFQFDINTAVEPTTILFEGMYVEVSGDSSPNMNRPWGCGFITGPVRHIGADSFVDVKYTVAHDGGRLHKNIHVMDGITVASYHQDMLMGVPQRAASLNQSRVEEEHEIAGDGRIKTEILIDLLQSGTRGRKGWHRRDLQLNPKLIKDAKTKPQLNSAEKAQLMFEVEMLRAYQKWNGGNRHLLRNRQKKFKKRVTKHDGRTKYDGAIVREKDQMYLVDCAVTGSNIGTADSPKFPLMSYFEETVFPRIIALVGPGGKFENYTVVIQGDNAGPHEDKVYKRYVEEYCGREGWHWEPQAPQMPHMNVLDLSVFPNMSKRHSS